jgi:hypothetical protein
MRYASDRLCLASEVRALKPGLEQGIACSGCGREGQLNLPQSAGFDPDAVGAFVSKVIASVCHAGCAALADRRWVD